MSKFIELKDSNTSYIINLEKVLTIYVSNDYIDKYGNPKIRSLVVKKEVEELYKRFFVEIRFGMEDHNYVRRYCNSELEAQMIYAKLKKKLCTDEELNEIL